jgi:hypothetical protein
VGEAATRESRATLREDLADLEARLDQTEASAAGLPHRSKHLLLATGFLRQLLDLHTQLVDDVEREAAPKPRRKARPHADSVMDS